jgi:hypothetical protein
MRKQILILFSGLMALGGIFAADAAETTYTRAYSLAVSGFMLVVCVGGVVNTIHGDSDADIDDELTRLQGRIAEMQECIIRQEKEIITLQNGKRTASKEETSNSTHIVAIDRCVDV